MQTYPPTWSPLPLMPLPKGGGYRLHPVCAHLRRRYEILQYPTRIDIDDTVQDDPGKLRQVQKGLRPVVRSPALLGIPLNDPLAAQEGLVLLLQHIERLFH